MKKLFLLVTLLLPLAVSANYFYRNSDRIAKDTTDAMENDTTAADIKFLNYNRNIDSLVSTLYSQPTSVDNPFVLSEADSTSIYADRPDSFYIDRLKKIPSVIGLTYNNIVKKYIEVYTIKKRDKLEEILALKNYYFPMFEEVLDSYDLPLELKYLAVIESALNPRAVSRCGATGLWQFMYGTGRLYKLTINSFLDERRDPLAETQAAARYLKDMYSIYNDWILVIAAYNCGPGNVNRAIRRSGGKTNYWDIYYYLPRETRGYVPAFIAATYSINFYKDHNLTPKVMEQLPYSDTVVVHKNIHLEQIADVLKVPVQLIRDLNPEYRRDVIPGGYSNCTLRLPAPLATKFVDLEDSIVRYKNTQFFANDFKVIDPMGSRYSRYTSVPAPANMKKLYHKVANGQTLGQISTIYHVSIADIRYWNDIPGNKIRAGRRLVIYVPKKVAAKYENLAAATDVNTSKETAGTDYIYYEVKSGDTIWKIASLYQGVTGDDLMKWNNLTDGSKIKPGEKI
ncbi:MAG TPA: transglycosylase SLT domain-containing protein, partial [Bacteroidales bacterium]